MEKTIQLPTSKWDRAFTISFHLTWIMPIALLLIQLISIGKYISFDVTNPSNWKGVDKAFSVPFGSFLFMVTTTTLIGLYTRSLQISEQLRLARAQQELSNEQLLLARKQAERYESQLNLSLKKESFMLYMEHTKQFQENLKQTIKSSKGVFRMIKSTDKERVVINYARLYRKTFPENTPTEMGNLTLESKEWLFDRSNPPINTRALKNLKPDMSERDIEITLREATESLLGIGIFVKANSDADEAFNLHLFMLDIIMVLTILQSIGLIGREDVDFIKGETMKYLKPLLKS
ncbi:hypothetical protein NQT63_02080 [Pseudoalteromonas agarivorans]|uniref:hypothetical protein n=1 Tax=Pseudoalteromonas agarivorans TaxID=176102 RepID=UPI002117F57D|nr:hypothetical protein [Pseudoalteromonas agarivorans]MCQ8884481.1 hypothetical protein [Pseudoalteromonas agarivorans]